jgi:ketosteroid isomerase-like protein
MIDAGNHVVVLGHWTSRMVTGKEFDLRFANIFELRDGNIVRLDSYLDTARVLHAFQGEVPGTAT